MNRETWGFTRFILHGSPFFCNLISKIICFFPDTPLDKSGKIVIIYNMAS